MCRLKRDEINVCSFRSSLSQMFFKIGVLKCFANSQKAPVLESLFNKVKGLKDCNY